ncbi:sodium-dependent organic anion transporter-like isoform X2 [Tachypleus tridentatus]
MDNYTESSNSTNTIIPILKKTHDVLVIVILVSIMFGMGCCTTGKQLWSHIRRPVSLIIGMICQFVIMPLTGFTLVKLLSISPLHATGVLIVSTCPGGAVSNVLTYFCSGDVPLSIAMTTWSTMIALGMMPLNLFMYGSNIATDDVVIPYVNILLSLIYITSPVAAGMLVRWKFPKVAPYFTKIGSIVGFGGITAAQVMEIFIFPDLFEDITWQIYFTSSLQPLLGITVGFTISWLLKRPPASCRTIGIESGIQNIGTALSVISLSFDFEKQKELLVFPWFYAMTMLGVSFLLVLAYQVYKRCSASTSIEVTSRQYNIEIIGIDPQKPSISAEKYNNLQQMKY